MSSRMTGIYYWENVMDRIPDLDDILDQLESTVTNSPDKRGLAQPSRGYFDPVPCYDPSKADSGTPKVSPRGPIVGMDDKENAAFNAPQMLGAAAAREEKLSFVEFLKVTAKEAEEMYNESERKHPEDPKVSKAVDRKPSRVVVQEVEAPAIVENDKVAAEVPRAVVTPQKVTEQEREPPPAPPQAPPAAPPAEKSEREEEEELVLPDVPTTPPKAATTISSDFDSVLEYLAEFDDDGTRMSEEHREAKKAREQVEDENAVEEELKQNEKEEDTQEESQKESEVSAEGKSEEQRAPSPVLPEDIVVPLSDSVAMRDTVAGQPVPEGEEELSVQTAQSFESADYEQDASHPEASCEGSPSDRESAMDADQSLGEETFYSTVSRQERSAIEEEEEKALPAYEEKTTVGLEAEAQREEKAEDRRETRQEEEMLDVEEKRNDSVAPVKDLDLSDVEQRSAEADTVEVHFSRASTECANEFAVDDVFVERVSLEIPATESTIDDPPTVENSVEKTEDAGEQEESNEGNTVAEEEPDDQGASVRDPEDFESGETSDEQHSAPEIVVEEAPAEVTPSSSGDPPEPEPAGSRPRFRERVISDVHEIDVDEIPSRLTESELMLGKTPPFWIPDVDCPTCMLCTLKFSFINRRHHCRACGRVLCHNCCNERTTLSYQEDGRKMRVCAPCLAMLARIEQYEKENAENQNNVPVAESEDAGGDPLQGPSGSTLPAPSATKQRTKSILKVRSQSESDNVVSVSPMPELEPGPSRGVVFRDGIKPGDSPGEERPPPPETTPAEDSAAKNLLAAQRSALRKKSRKRAAISRRVAELRVEEYAACVLPASDTECPRYLVERHARKDWIDEQEVQKRLMKGDPVQIVINRLVACKIAICKDPVSDDIVWYAGTEGMNTVGLDEIVLVWKKECSPSDSNGEQVPSIRIPLHVLHRMAELFTWCFSPEYADIRRVASRMPRLHTSTTDDGAPPLTRHTLLFTPSHQIVRGLPLPLHPYVFAMPVLDEELKWALAAPNRLLLRLGLYASCYPSPIVADPNRPPVYTKETNASVLKMFTDFVSWSYRMPAVGGVTVSLTDEETTINIPHTARAQLRKIADMNRNMLTWLCDVNTAADSHLVCKEAEDGFGYETSIFNRGGERKLTGATFVIIDGALKTPNTRVQVNVCEDGVAIRLSADAHVEMIDALLDGKDLTISSSGMRLCVRWQTMEAPEESQAVSIIDGLYLGDRMQYGVTLERAVTSSIQSTCMPDHAIRLSHVYNLRDNNIPAEDEAKVFSVVEMIAHEVTGMIDPHLPMLIDFDIDTIALRVNVSSDRIEYSPSKWEGLDEEMTIFRQSLDQILHILCNFLGHLPHGFHVEMVLTIINTAPLPVE